MSRTSSRGRRSRGESSSSLSSMATDPTGSLDPSRPVKPMPAALAVWMNVRRFIDPHFTPDRERPTLFLVPVSSFPVHRERQQQITGLAGDATIPRIYEHHALGNGCATVVQ